MKKKEEKKRKMDKWVKRGAIIGGIWGLIALPVYWVFGFIFWGRTVPLLENVLSVLLFFPASLIRPFLPENVLGMILGLFLNVIGWMLIGGMFGYLYVLLRRNKL